MKARLPLRSLALALVGAPLLVSSAATNARFSSSTRLSSDQVEDIGEISEVGGSTTSNGKDYKGTTPPPAPEANHFRFNVGTRAQYTTNAKLSGDHDSSDVIFLPSLEAGYHTPLGTKFSFDSAFRLESGAYVANSDRSFIGYSLQNTLDYRPRPNLPRIFIGAEPYRYDNFDRGRSITEAIALSVGSDYGIAFNHGKSMAFIGYTFADHFANPSIDSRRSNTAIVGVSHTFTPVLTGQFFYQYEYSNFYDYDRDDSRHTLGANLTYQFRRHLFGTLSANWSDNNSSDDRASYQTAGVSLGINLQY